MNYTELYKEHCTWVCNATQS